LCAEIYVLTVPSHEGTIVALSCGKKLRVYLVATDVPNRRTRVTYRFVFFKNSGQASGFRDGLIMGFRFRPGFRLQGWAYYGLSVYVGFRLILHTMGLFYV
jgi:hypothetical protein